MPEELGNWDHKDSGSHVSEVQQAVEMMSIERIPENSPDKDGMSGLSRDCTGNQNGRQEAWWYRIRQVVLGQKVQRGGRSRMQEG